MKASEGGDGGQAQAEELATQVEGVSEEVLATPVEEGGPAHGEESSITSRGQGCFVGCGFWRSGDEGSVAAAIAATTTADSLIFSTTPGAAGDAAGSPIIPSTASFGTRFPEQISLAFALAIAFAFALADARV